MFSQKLKSGIIALALFTMIGGLIWSVLTKHEPAPTRQTINLTAEQQRQIKETLLKERSDIADQQVLKMIGHDIRQAEVCWDCREFQEWASGSFYVVYPVIGHRVQQGDIRYTLVIGQIGWHAGDPMKMKVMPRSAIYVDRNDGIFRITDEGQMMYTDKSGGWMWSRVSHLSVEDKMKREAITALQKSIVQSF
ncbi:MAG: hypothetical protein A3A96_03305 [Candidatus Zambryskibacteria bacterium RIFCSPLOWO2_01_FULL_39_39]|uniref:Uncharacterized protein n=1 Tax=Candidatus Zambryskibacteria bacterium RIFCSPLOWO2_01_FULL_39_39 TaxID=1802758 RepID=A0A1G2TWV9_9BACT|nr:MAG: hypothetical protein A2644_02695 [Candidatus Zambryskibacteria bacterium RIFCSPHIGHO2_01_FULL_39_63]OHA94382.1 MAG: hypothetical protein A3B88_01620 [Candidatus Zambryskibacteria bacterium RIFCSPHIGHO2_02_FULL_39_19]OHA97924.1 MAG: hypothetical protein A3F20_00605 [Candidatus Zambryskibacteria bacterium RIFCSPHIGHO2_12_FULL_39_21]OHB01663.1 MAG: hypothetical protein A3A96_03305 [Candidatus Zambryskibacteria bacterium RIFCSPLOWO2_01_FULL_39_39]